MSITTDPRVIYEDDKVKQIIRQTGEGKILVQTIDKPEPERKHHACSPSSLQYVEACPHFRNHDEVHAAAIAGTIQHSVTETGEDDMRLSDDQALHAAECLDFFERRKQLMDEDRHRAIDQAERDRRNLHLPAGAFPPIIDIPETLVFVEEYLPIDDLVRDFPGIGVEQSTTAGYVDRQIVAWDRKRAEIIDWKFGAWIVEKAEFNLQGIAYALGVFRKHPTVNEVLVTFKQPQIGYLTQHLFKRSDLPALYLRVCTVIERRIRALGLKNYEMASPRIPVCLFCANKADCKPLLDLALNIAKKFSPLDVPADITPSMVSDPKQSSLRMKLAQVMGIWAKAMKTQTLAGVLSLGLPEPDGYKLTKGTSRRAVVDEMKFREVALRHLTEDELRATASYALTKVEEAINDKAPRMSKAATVDAFKAAAVEAGAVKLGEKFTYLKATSAESE